MTGARLSRWRRWRVLGVAVLAVCALTVTLAPPPVETTSAEWTDTENTTATFQAATLLPPVLVTAPRCAAVPALGGLTRNVMSFDWRFPEGELYDGLDETDVQWTIAGALGSVTFPGTSTGDTAAPYTLSVGPALIDRLRNLDVPGVVVDVAALLGIILSGTFTVQGRVEVGEWTSAGWAGGDLGSVLGLIPYRCVSASGTS